MQHRAVAAGLVLWLLSVPLASAQVHVGQLLPDTKPGESFSLAGDNLTAKRWRLTFGKEKEDGTSTPALPSAVDPQKLTFVVPPALPPGAYLLRVQEDDAAPVFVGQITVVPLVRAEATTPLIIRTVPTASWWKLWRYGSQYDFDILGDRLPGPPTNDAASTPARVSLYLGTERIDLRPCAAGSEDLTEVVQTRPCFLAQDGQRLSVHGIPTRLYGGPHKMAIETVQGRSNAEAIRISRVTPRMIKWLSLGAVAILIGVMVFVGRDVFAASTGSSVRKRFLGWLLLDAQTNTFSLAKLQFLSWMITVGYCYLFLQLALVYVQGQTAIAALPDGFGWLFGITGGTSLASIFLTQAHGPKGAGSAEPALSDLVSSGGVLAPDRAQLLLWTLIGCGVFLMAVLRQPTDTIKVLPDLPNSLLTAMGISALVYAGGKSIRLPGPVINEVTVDVAANTIVLKGQNLHQNALISLDGQLATVTLTPSSPSGQPNQGLFSELKLAFTPLPFGASDLDHQIRLTNLDGQYAEAWFAVTPPTLTKVTDARGKADEVAVSTNDVEVSLTGTGFRVGSSAEWQPSGSTSLTAIPAAKVSVQDDKTATVTFAPGKMTGGATLTIVSPHGIRAARRVTVVA